MKKLIDLTPECVRQLNIEAAKKGTNAKNLIESIIEREAVRLAKKDKPKQHLTSVYPLYFAYTTRNKYLNKLK